MIKMFTVHERHGVKERSFDLVILLSGLRARGRSPRLSHIMFCLKGMVAGSPSEGSCLEDPGGLFCDIGVDSLDA